MLDTTTAKPRIRRMLDIFVAAPLEWLIAATLALGLMLHSYTPSAVDLPAAVWVGPAIITIPMLLLCRALASAGIVGRLGRGIGVAAILAMGLGIGLTTYQSAEPATHLMPRLAVPVSALLLLPLAGPRLKKARASNLALWRRGSRLLVRLTVGLIFAGWLALLAGALANAFATSWAGLAALAVAMMVMLNGALFVLIGVASQLATAPGRFSRRLDSVELLLTQFGFAVASITTICGTIWLYVDRATAFANKTLTGDVELQATLLVILAIAGPLAHFLGAPFLTGNNGHRGRVSQKLGTLLRLFAPAFLVLLAWSGPAVITYWSRGGWHPLASTSACIIAACTAHCALRTVFVTLGRELPLWVLPTIYAAAALAVAMFVG